MSAFPETRTLFLCPPSIGALRTRLENRGTETPQTIHTRLTNAIKEIEIGMLHGPATLGYKNVINDKEDNFNSCLVEYRLINDDLEKAATVFICLIEGMYVKELGL